MKIRDVIFDLTAFLDVILVLLFLVLMLNTGEMAENRAQLSEVDNQRILAEAERAAAEYALADAQARLAILMDWDNELTNFMVEIESLQDWRAAVMGSASFIFIEMNITDEVRVVHVNAAPNIFRSAEVRWDATGRNIIENRDELRELIHDILSEITAITGTAHPVMIIFDPNITGTAQQESQLIGDAVHQFIYNMGDDVNIYYSARAIR